MGEKDKVTEDFCGLFELKSAWRFEWLRLSRACLAEELISLYYAPVICIYCFTPPLPTGMGGWWTDGPANVWGYDRLNVKR